MSARETAERLCRQALYPSIHEDDARHPNERLIEAVATAITQAQAEALEAAAKVVETHPGVPIQYNEATTEWRQASKFDMAHAIRNLKAKE